MPQILEFVGAVVKNLPEVSPDIMQGWIENPKALQKVLREALVPSLVFKVIPTFDRDMRKENWALEKDSSVQTGDFRPELEELFEGEEKVVSGRGLLERAQKKDALTSQRHAEGMLREAKKIPEEYRQYVLIFADTIWEDSDGNWRVACLRWIGNSWCLKFDNLDYYYYRVSRLVRSRCV